MGRIVDENGYDLYPDYEEPEEVITDGNEFSYEDELSHALEEGKLPVINFHIQNYTCESGALAKFVIPDNATADDLLGIKELLDIVIKRKFKVCGDAERTESCERRKDNDRKTN